MDKYTIMQKKHHLYAMFIAHDDESSIGPSHTRIYILYRPLYYPKQSRRIIGSRGKLLATLIVGQRACLSTISMINISKTKRFRGSCPIGSLRVDYWRHRWRHVSDVIKSQSSKLSHSETKTLINFHVDPLSTHYRRTLC